MAKRDYVPGLGDRLKEVRKAAGLTQAAAGEAAGVHHISITKYETGVQTPTVAVLYKLAAAYGVTVCDLLPDPPAEGPQPTAARPVKVLAEAPRPEPTAAPAKPKRGK